MKPITTSERITEQGGITASFFNDIKKIPMFESNEEEVAVAKLAAQGDESARKALVERNLRFIITVANSYHCDRIHTLDLINEGAIGLIKAAESYDPSRGVKFISFAVWYIRKHISEHILDHYETISAPANKSYSLKKYDKLKAKLEQVVGYEVGLDEVLFANDDSFSTGEIEYLKSTQYTNNIKSLDDTFSDDTDSSSLRDMISYDDVLDIDSEIDKKTLISKLYKRMRRLSVRERKVIELCYGLKNGEAVDISTCAMILNMTDKTVLQVKKRAEKAMMH